MIEISKFYTVGKSELWIPVKTVQNYKGKFDTSSLVAVFNPSLQIGEGFESSFTSVHVRTKLIGGKRKTLKIGWTAFRFNMRLQVNVINVVTRM